VKKAVTIRWNIIGFAGGGAFFLSFLLGTVSGNGFLVFFFRAILFGIIFALLGGGIAYLVERFIPEIAGIEPVANRERKKAENIDIILEAENPLKEGEIEELSFEDNAETVEKNEETAASMAEEPEKASRQPQFADGNENTMTSLKEEDNEVSEDKENFDFGQEETVEESVEDETGREQAGVEKKTDIAGIPTTGIKKTSKEEVIESSDLDILPDMSSFESSFAPIVNSGTVDESQTFDSLDRSSLKTGTLDKDPVQLTKAVRTILKRDEGKRND
jgi:hypothetical protein